MPDAVDAGLTDPVWISIADAARQQQPPVSRAAMHKRVSRLVEAGRLATRPGPRGTVLVNIVALNRAIMQETDPAQALRNHSLLAEPADDAAEPAAEPVSGSSYHTSRAAREAYQAENARLDLDERLGRLVDKDDVERRTMTVVRKIRDRLLAMPATMADRVAAAPDARAVRSLLTEEIRTVLDQLAHELEAMDTDDDDDGAGESAPGEPAEAAA